MIRDANSLPANCFGEIMTIHLASESGTRSLAARLAALVRPGDVLCLFGDLGAGKTSFARAFIRALTAADQEVPSPTFTLVQIYETGDSADSLTIWHADLYRLSSPDEAAELGIEEAFAEAVVLIEWPERALEILPAKRLELHLEFCDKISERSIALLGDAHWRDRLGDLLATGAS
jgi:tRNA threonylcarbamoyladenosine biosynthesis protein TsaE